MENLSAQISNINLLIDQGALDEAERQAQEALQAHPSSATIHALMGDIAAARRDSREAIDWYELSLRLERNPQVQARLERERAQLEREAEAEIDQLLERPRDRRQRLVIYGAIGGLVVVGVVVALIASALSGRPREPRGGGRAAAPRPTEQAGAPALVPPEPGAPLPQAPGASPPPPPVGGRPAASATARPATGVAAPTTPPPPPGLIRMTERVEAPLSDRDRLLSQALSGITWGTGEPLGWRVMALVDDFTGYALITVEVPPGVQRARLSDTVIDMAYKLAVATIQADSGVQSLTIRVMAPVEVERREAMLLAFRANTTRDHLEYYLRRGLQPDRATIWSHVFATTWWNPSVPSGVETAQ